MQNCRSSRVLAALIACLMIMGLLLTAVPDVKADGGEPISIQTINQVPLGDFQLDLHLRQNLRPEDVGSTPIVEINNTAEIIDYTGPGGRIIIPSIVQYPLEGIQLLDPPEDMDEPLGIRENVIRVSSIASEAFKGRTDIVSITIPEGVENIGANAFSGCTNLVELLFLGSTMPGNVSEFWLDGTPEGLQGFASYCPSISFLGTQFHGLMVFNFGSPSMGGFDTGPPQAPLSGLITDQNGKPMSGVIVTAANGRNCTTDAGGRFLLTAPLGLGNFSVSGPSIQHDSFFAYLGLGGAEMGKIQISLAESSGETHTNEAVALMIGIIVLAIVLLVVSMVVANKRMKKE